MTPENMKKVVDLCNQISNITYENLTKIIRLEQTGSATGARKLDDSDQNDIDSWMGGGTCFSMTWHLYQALTDMGLKPRLVMGHKRKERNIHCALILPDPDNSREPSVMSDAFNHLSSNTPYLKATEGSDLIPHTCKWADMGAGAGCPVFPLAIVMPEVEFFAVEPRHMRVEFMNYAKEKLQLSNMTVVGKRFETSGLSNLDFISCRALSTFENDWERAMPGLKKGGTFVTLKSFNNIVHLENDPAVHIYKYVLPQEEQSYALVTRGNE